MPAVDAAAELLAKRCAPRPATLPEVSEIEIIRHFTRLSTWNYWRGYRHLSAGLLHHEVQPARERGSRAARWDRRSASLQPEALSQGALRIVQELSEHCSKSRGMDAVTLQPAAGAQGELTGLLLIRAYLESQGNPRRKVLIPDSAHGTNPATAAMAGYQWRT